MKSLFQFFMKTRLGIIALTAVIGAVTAVASLTGVTVGVDQAKEAQAALTDAYRELGQPVIVSGSVVSPTINE